MDRTWMYLEDRSCKDFVYQVKLFIHLAVYGSGDRKEGLADEWEKRVIRCPCRECKNAQIHDAYTVESHLHKHGFKRNYKRFLFHGEEIGHTSEKFETDGSDDEDGAFSYSVRGSTPSSNILEDLVGAGSTSRGGGLDSDFTRLFNQSGFQVSPECTKMSRLDFLAKLMHLKVLNHWSDKSFDMFLRLVNGASPENSNRPSSYDDARKLLKGLGFGYELIHACKYNCALFWKEHASCDRCPICREPRYLRKINIDNYKNEKYPEGDYLKIDGKITMSIDDNRMINAIFDDI